MKKTMLISVVLVLWATPILFSQELQQQGAEIVIGEIESIAQQLIKQGFYIPTSLDESERMWTVVPGYFRINGIQGDIELEGYPLDSLALGAGYTLGLKGPWMVYGIYSGVYLRGELQGDFLGGFSDPQELTVQQDFHNLMAGVGYDIVDFERLSLPVYLGLHGQYYNYDWQSNQVSLDDFSGQASVQIHGQGILWGISGGGAVKMHFGPISISPYGLFMVNFYAPQG
ncbi:MAG: hypothetical protein PF447_10490, partial [Spirochaetaceae bacterium]|nr:hypothetical protein [Spirochaetaceae bacterium]